MKVLEHYIFHVGTEVHSLYRTERSWYKTKYSAFNGLPEVCWELVAITEEEAFEIMEKELQRK